MIKTDLLGKKRFFSFLGLFIFLFQVSKAQICDNVVDGGSIAGYEIGCADPTFDPGLISNVIAPSGGSGTLEYMWMKTEGDPTLPIINWTPIPNSNTQDYDPDPISVTTHYTRCSRREFCTDFTGETNIITKEVFCCENVTDGGQIGADQSTCEDYLIPDLLTNTVSPSGGNGNLIYAWYFNTTGAPFDISNPDWILISGAILDNYQADTLFETTHYVRVSKREGCDDFTGLSNIVSINIFDKPMIDLADLSNPLCYNSKDGAINLQVNGGTGIYNFDWIPSLPNTSNPTGLESDTYHVTVTDSNGCTVEDTYVLENPIEIIIETATAIENCNPINGGSAWVSVSQGVGPFYYEWSDLNTTQSDSLLNIGSGNYFISVTNDNNCLVIDSVEIDLNDALTVNLLAQNPNCAGEADGSISSNVSGGSGVYSYLWSNNSTDGQLDNLTSGTYRLTVTDDVGCQVIDSTSLVEPDTLKLELAAKDNCGMNSGRVTPTVSGGTQGYSFLWSTGSRDSVLFNLSAGTYTLTLTDANGCERIDSASVRDMSTLTIEIFNSPSTCLSSADGSAWVTASGGTGAYTYLWNDPAQQTNDTILNLQEGTYGVTVTDSDGCWIDMFTTIASQSSLEVDISTTNVTCFERTDGSAIAISTGGLGTIDYLWNDGSTLDRLNNLGIGQIWIEVTDSLGCTASDTASLSQPDLLESDLIVQGTCDINSGSITTNVVGGTSPYQYLWNTNATTSALTNLPAGTYYLIITDANGCVQLDTAEIFDNSTFQLDLYSQAADCVGDNNGFAWVVATGGTGTYSYLWDDVLASETDSIFNLSAGTYSVTVTDSKGCIKTGNIQVGEQSAIDVSISKTDVDCYGASTGSLSAITSGGIGSSTFLWSTGDVGADLDGLSVGNYSVQATDSLGCIATDTIDISSPSVITLSFITKDNCGTDDGYIQATANGGVAPYSFNWNTSDTISNIQNLASGQYILTITDANGCIFSDTSEIFDFPQINLVTGASSTTCNYNTDGSAWVIVSGGSGTFTYLWDNAMTNDTINNLGTGTYFVTVTDTNGCSENESVSVASTSIIQVSASTNSVTCFGGSDGSAQINVTGHSGSFTQLWSTGDTLNSISGLAQGDYWVEATDDLGCVNRDSFTINQAPELICQAIIISNYNGLAISTYGGNDGIASVSASGGTGNLTYSWSNNSTNAAIANLSSGTYAVTVTDENDCTCISSVTLEDPAYASGLVWHDLNQDGIRDLNEPFLNNVLVELLGTTNSGSSVSRQTATDPQGNYYFDGIADGDYYIHFPRIPGYVLTLRDIGSDSFDSDPDPDTGNTDNFVLDLGDQIAFDAGYFVGSGIDIGDYVWFDTNQDGLQDNIEGGVENFKVHLKNAGNGSLVQTLWTNSDGKYLFKNVDPGQYYIEFDFISLPGDYTFSKKDEGNDDELDSDADVNTGRTDIFTIVINQADDLSFDAGIHEICDDLTDGGVISGDETLCGANADPAIIQNVVFPTGGSGTIEYIWMVSNTPIYTGPGDPNWSMIPNTNTPSYDPGPIFQSTYYIRCARREGCVNFISETGVVSKIVIDYPVTNIEVAPSTACLNEVTSFEATSAGTGASYAWRFDQGASPATANSRVVSTVLWTQIGQKEVILTVTKDGCSLSDTAYVAITNCLGNLGGFKLVNASLFENTYVKLNWKTNGNDKETVFFVEKSEDGVNFNNISLLNGLDSELGNSYSFQDNNLAEGECFYRIKQMDAQNRSITSELQTINVAPGGRKICKFYPNPVEDLAQIEIFAEEYIGSKLTVFDAYGGELNISGLNWDENRIDMDLKNLSTGTYFLRLELPKRRPEVIKIVKN